MKVNHISTIGVVGDRDDSVRICLEDDDLGQSGNDCAVLHSNGYNQTKWVAERLILSAESAGLRTTIYRPGFISWDTRSGQSNVTDWLSRFLLACLKLNSFPVDPSFKSFMKYGAKANNDELPYPPKSVVGVNLIPVDYVSQAIVYLGSQSQILDKDKHPIHQLNNTKFGNVSFNQMAVWFKEVRPDASLIPLQDWSKQIQEIGFETFLPLLSMFSHGFPNAGRVDDSKFQQAICAAPIATRIIPGVTAPDQKLLEIGLGSFSRHLEWLSKNQ
eukprot:TRINITY_DN14934_c0_g1_i2.p1 TRINITY_DN14934_c0_g1~~TRINITY_DN14934_c0_g1_i2.p1  ORF type:complete len:273 (-),score=51.38 TRINITY_DN14934_c0_g1_i2:92-910(-)